MEETKYEPLVSVVMAAYNAQNTIATAIHSILDQTYSNWELIIIDDYSQDNTVSIVHSFTDQRIRLFENKQNSGVSLTRKKGLDVSNGEWIAVLDSDDMWAPSKLDEQIGLAERKKAELIFTGSGFMDESGKRLDWQLHVPKLLTYRELLKQNLVSNSSVLVKKELYKKHYAIGDDMHEDFAIWLGITKEGITAYGIDEPLLIYRITKTSKSSNKLKAAKMNWNTYRYIGLNPIKSFYFMCWYTVKGIQKYSHLK